MRNLFDPKMYKHVKSDDKKTTLRHKKGHEITIAHNVLEPKHKAMLDALSKISDETATEGQKQEKQDEHQYGKVIMKADGGKVDPKFAAITEKQTQMAKQRHPEPSHDEKQKLAHKHKTQDQFMKNTAGKSMKVEYADGGRVPTPATPRDEATSDRQRNLKDASQVTQKQTDKSQMATASDPAQVWDNIKNAWAEGGQIEKECYACGGPMHRMKDGGSVEDADTGREFEESEAHAKKTIPEEINDNVNSFSFDPQEAINGSHMPSNLPQGRAQMNDMQQLDPEKPVLAKAAQPVADWLMTDNSKPPVEPKLRPQIEQATPEMEQPSLAPQPMNSPNIPGPEGLATEGMRLEKLGATQAAAAQGQLGQQQADVLQNDIQRRQEIQNHFDNNFNDLNSERHNHITDIRQGYINPEQYWEGDDQGHGGHSKIMAALGMIISGFGAGLSGQPNAALAYINSAIDRNINAQAKNLDTKKSLLGYNLDQFKNMRDASDMTRVMQADVVKSQIDQAAAKAATPLAAAAANKAKGEIDAKYQPIFMNLALRHTLQGLGSGQSTSPGTVGTALSTLDAIAPDQAKTYRERYYAPYDMPGGKSIADRPIDNKTREELVAHDKFNTAAGQLKQIIERSRGNINSLNPVERNAAAQQALILQSLFREGTLGTVYREGEQPLLDKAVSGQPLALVHYFTELPKLDGLVQHNNAMKQTTLNAYGLHAPPQKSQNHQQPVKGKDGRMYIRQGNYMVPVK